MAHVSFSESKHNQSATFFVFSQNIVITQLHNPLGHVLYCVPVKMLIIMKDLVFGRELMEDSQQVICNDVPSCQSGFFLTSIGEMNTIDMKDMICHENNSMLKT